MECGLQWKDITCWEDASRLTLTHEETLETAIADYCGMRRDTLQNRVKSQEGLKFGEIWLLTWKLGMKEATTDCLCRGEKVS